MKEQWMPVKGYEKYYKVSTFGRVWSRSRITPDGRKIGGKFRKFGKTRGYYYVPLTKNGKSVNYTIHRLVAMAFIPNPENKREVNHKDGNKLNNKVNNLDWVTPKENGEHASKNGLLKGYDKHGLNNPKCRLSKQNVSDILDALIAGEGFMKDIAPRFNISVSVLCSIKSGGHWAVKKSKRLQEKAKILQKRGCYYFWLKSKLFREQGKAWLPRLNLQRASAQKDNT